MLIFTHAVPKERRVTIGPKLLQQFPNGFFRESDWLGTSEVRCITTGGRCQSTAEAHSASSWKRSATRRVRTLQNVSFTALHVCFNSVCNTTLEKNQVCMNEHCRRSDPCQPRAKAKPRPRRSSRMCCVDFFCWKTRHSQEPSKCLSSVLPVKSYTYSHTANAFRETWGNDERLRRHDISPCRNSFKAAMLLAAYTGQVKKTSGRKQTATTRIHWTRGHLNGMTSRDMTTSHIPKNRTGPRTSTRLTSTMPTTAPSRNTFLHCWTNLSKHKKETRANWRPFKKQ